jgi:hypothetical protein
VYLTFMPVDDRMLALLLSPEGQVQTLELGNMPDLSEEILAYRVLLSYPTFYKQAQVQKFIWQDARGKLSVGAAAPETGARRLEKPAGAAGSAAKTGGILRRVFAGTFTGQAGRV